MWRHGVLPISELQQLSHYARPSLGRAIWQVLNTLPTFVILWLCMAWSVRENWNYAFTLLMAVPVAGIYVRMFIIQHDCGHGSFFRSQHSNHWLGACIGLITLFPYGYWKKTHAIHHGTSGNLDRREFGDVRTLTLKEYLALSRWDRFRYRLYRSMPVLLGVGPVFQIVIKHRGPYDLPLGWKREWRSVLLNDLMLVVLWSLCCLALGWRTVLLVHVPVFLLAGAAGVWLFYVQHVFEDTYWARQKDWQPGAAAVAGSSYYDLPRVLHWFTGNIGYHHVHHLAPRIPNYRLRAALLSHPLLQQAKRLTLLGSFKCARLKLWDEDQGRMIGLPRRR